MTLVRFATGVGVATLLLGGFTTESRAQPPTLTFGPASETSHTLQSFAFGPATATDATRLALDRPGSRYCAGGGCGYSAPLLLPAGALIVGMELEACDFDAGLDVVAQLVRHVRLDEDASTVIALVTTTGAPGCTAVRTDLPVPAVVDNVNRSYNVEISMGNSSDTRFRAIRVFYRLQVSPAPATATFGDVPTSHPFFQFVEALVASGITAGCGGGNYCPDAPLTRGQMAVFLSKALGLHFAP
jgi:hypothetical protein